MASCQCHGFGACCSLFLAGLVSCLRCGFGPSSLSLGQLTLSRALALLRDEGLIYTVRGTRDLRAQVKHPHPGDELAGRLFQSRQLGIKRQTLRL
jgi:hypothetical protein